MLANSAFLINVVTADPEPLGRWCGCVGVPMYFFHLVNGYDVPDHEGTALPDLQAARAYAITQVRSTFSETVKDEGRVALSHRIDIEDEHGTVLDTVYFRDAVTVDD